MVHLSLDERILGQIMDAIEVRQEAWSKTAAWYRGELDDPFFVIEQCSDDEEAEDIAALYAEIERVLRFHLKQHELRSTLAVPIAPQLDERSGWCLMVDVLVEGVTPTEFDETGCVVVYPSKRQAEEAWAIHLIESCEEFLRRARVADEVESGFYVAPVNVASTGKVTLL